VLDWETAGVGPPEVDLAWSTFFQRFFAHCTTASARSNSAGTGRSPYFSAKLLEDLR